MKSRMVILNLLFFFGVMICSASDVWADRKKDFHILMGIGTGPSFQLQDSVQQNIARDRQKAFIYASGLKIGMALSRRSVLSLMYRTNYRSLFGEQQQGISGIEVNYYVTDRIPSLFVTGGIGYSEYRFSIDSHSDAREGMGTLFGVGYDIDGESHIEFNAIMSGRNDRVFSIVAMLYFQMWSK